MRHATKFSVTHVVVHSDRPYDAVKTALEQRMGLLLNTDEFIAQVKGLNLSWEELKKRVQARLGGSGFTIFNRIEHGELLSLSGKPRKVGQYAIGNPLLAIEMIEHVPEIALYAPLRITIYESEQGKACVAYDRLSSQVAQYGRRDMLEIAERVESKVEALIAEVTGTPAERT